MNFSQKIFLPELSIRHSKWKILSEINPNKSINFKRYHSPIPYTHIYIKSQRIKVKSKKCSCHIQPYFSISFLTFFANQPIHPSIHPPSFFQAGFPLIRSQIGGMQRNKLHSKNPSVLFILHSSTLVNPFCPPHQKKSRRRRSGRSGRRRRWRWGKSGLPATATLPPLLIPPSFFPFFLKLRPYSRLSSSRSWPEALVKIGSDLSSIRNGKASPLISARKITGWGRLKIVITAHSEIGIDIIARCFV